MALILCHSNFWLDVDFLSSLGICKTCCLHLNFYAWFCLGLDLKLFFFGALCCSLGLCWFLVASDCCGFIDLGHVVLLLLYMHCVLVISHVHMYVMLWCCFTSSKLPVSLSLVHWWSSYCVCCMVSLYIYISSNFPWLYWCIFFWLALVDTWAVCMFVVVVAVFIWLLHSLVILALYL